MIDCMKYAHDIKQGVSITNGIDKYVSILYIIDSTS